MAHLARSTVIAVAALWLAGCERTPAPEVFRGPTMGTTYSVEIAGRPAGVTHAALQADIDAVLGEVNRSLSTYDPASEISRFNAATSTEPVAVSPAFASVVATALRVSAATDGAFDITVGPVVRAWGFGVAGGGQGPRADPDAPTLQELRAAVGYERLELSGNRLRKLSPAVQLDVDGIAPGYAVDEIVRRLSARGVTDFLVELGGEIRARGRSPVGRPWRVAVEVPVEGERRPYAVAELDDRAASTSGDYRDFRIEHDRRLSHTIDPRSAAPVDDRLASVCVVHDTTAEADAYATAMMVLGAGRGYELAERLGLAALFIERAPGGKGFTERATPAFQRLRRPFD